MTPYQNEAAGELLWKYVEELKRAEGTDAVNFIARTSVDPAEMATLLPLADAVHEMLQTEASVVNGQPARDLLAAAIRADDSHAPSAPEDLGPLARLCQNRPKALLVLLALISTAILSWVMIWNTYRDHSVIAPPAPASTHQISPPGLNDVIMPGKPTNNLATGGDKCAHDRH